MGQRATIFRDATMYHASARRSSLAVPMGTWRGNRLGGHGGERVSSPDLPEEFAAGQLVPSGTILRGSVDVNRPMTAPELASRPKVTSLGMLGRGPDSTATALLWTGVGAEGIVWTCLDEWAVHEGASVSRRQTARPGYRIDGVNNDW